MVQLVPYIHNRPRNSLLLGIFGTYFNPCIATEFIILMKSKWELKYVSIEVSGLYKQFYDMNVLNCLLQSKDTVKAGPWKPYDALKVGLQE